MKKGREKGRDALLTLPCYVKPEPYKRGGRKSSFPLLGGRPTANAVSFLWCAAWASSWAGRELSLRLQGKGPFQSGQREPSWPGQGSVVQNFALLHRLPGYPRRRACQKQCCIALRGNGGIGCRKFGRLVVGGLLHCLLAWSHRLCSVPGYGLRRIPGEVWRRYVSGCRLYGAVAYVRRVRPRGVDPCIVGKQGLFLQSVVGTQKVQEIASGQAHECDHWGTVPRRQQADWHSAAVDADVGCLGSSGHFAPGSGLFPSYLRPCRRQASERPTRDRSPARTRRGEAERTAWEYGRFRSCRTHMTVSVGGQALPATHYRNAPAPHRATWRREGVILLLPPVKTLFFHCASDFGNAGGNVGSADEFGNDGATAGAVRDDVRNVVALDASDGDERQGDVGNDPIKIIEG